MMENTTGSSPGEVHPLIRARYSSRLMDPDRAVPPMVIEALLEAARWAPSSGNGQPWRFVVFDDGSPQTLDHARSLLNPGNHKWASRAPVLILAVAREVRRSGKTNAYAQHDLGLATQNLLLQATWMGLHVRPMAGFDRDGAEEAFGIPEGHRAMVMIAVGYPGKLEDVDKEVRAKEELPRQRKPQEQFVFWGHWPE